MLSDGIHPIGEGLLEVAEERLRGLLVPEDINEVYEVEQTPFARGKFAAVRRAVHKKSGVHFAAKFLRRRRRAQSSDKEIKHEIAVLILCSGSENIVNLNAVHESRSDTALLLELATGGELQAILDDEGSLTEAQSRFCMRQVLKALQFLHKRSIAHLDLKPQNILLTGKRVEDGLKLCDFGISRVIENGSKIREILGTPDYVAPEVLQYEPLSLQTDIWSVGVLAYVLLTGCTPFGGDTKQETFLNISQCSLTFPDELFKDISPGAIDFIKSALRIKPEERLTTLECLEHNWLKDESPISSTYLTMSSTSRDMTEHDRDIIDSNDIKSNGCDRYKSEIDIDTRSSQRYTSRSSNDSNEHDKENFLINSSKPTSVTNYSPNKFGLDTVKINAQSKLSSTPTKLFNSGKYINNDVHCTPLKHQHNGLTETTVDYVRTCLEKNRSPPSVPTTITTATICLFPDAPTTPKVIRKTPSESTRSVKALVKKFQLETNDEVIVPTMHTTQIKIQKDHHLHSMHEERSKLCSSNDKNSKLTTTTTTSAAVTTTPSTNRAGCSRTENGSFKNSCVFCLTCGGPECRHSGRTTVSKSSGSLGMDQGIIC